MGRFRKLVLRIDFGEGRWPLCALELGPRALRTSEEREKLCAKGLMVSLRLGQYLKTSPRTNDALFSSSSSFFSLSRQRTKPFRAPFRRWRNPFPKLGFADNGGAVKKRHVFSSLVPPLECLDDEEWRWEASFSSLRDTVATNDRVTLHLKIYDQCVTKYSCKLLFAYITFNISK